MTKHEYIASYLCATALDMQHAETREALRGIAKTLVNIANELERIAGPAWPDSVQEPVSEPQKAKSDEGGETVTNPVPPPTMPPSGSSNPLDKIRALANAR